MIDLHCHLLPGVDDGPATMPEAIAMARDAVADGTHTIAVTPHVNSARRVLDADRIAAAVLELRAEIDRAGVRLNVHTGAEVSGIRAMELDDRELRRLTLGEGGWLLLESPLSPSQAPGFAVLTRALIGRGHRILLAHPERSPLFLRGPDLLDDLVDEGALAQVTAGALAGHFGGTVRRGAQAMIARGSVHVIASDGHGAERPARTADDLQAAGLGAALRHWMTEAVPAALLAGEEVPPRPEGSDGTPRRSLLGALRRRTG